MSSWKHHEPHPVTGTCVWCHANSTSSVGCTRGESAEEKVARLESERRKGGAVTLDSLSERIARMWHAFDDRQRKAAVRRLADDAAALESELAAARAENERLQSELTRSASLNCALVGQNTRLIERNLMLGDTPPAWSAGAKEST